MDFGHQPAVDRHLRAGVVVLQHIPAVLGGQVVVRDSDGWNLGERSGQEFFPKPDKHIDVCAIPF